MSNNTIGTYWAQQATQISRNAGQWSTQMATAQPTGSVNATNAFAFSGMSAAAATGPSALSIGIIGLAALLLIKKFKQPGQPTLREQFVKQHRQVYSKNSDWRKPHRDIDPYPKNMVYYSQGNTADKAPWTKNPKTGKYELSFFKDTFDYLRKPYVRTLQEAMDVAAHNGVKIQDEQGNVRRIEVHQSHGKYGKVGDKAVAKKRYVLIVVPDYSGVKYKGHKHNLEASDQSQIRQNIRDNMSQIYGAKNCHFTTASMSASDIEQKLADLKAQSGNDPNAEFSVFIAGHSAVRDKAQKARLNNGENLPPEDVTLSWCQEGAKGYEWLTEQDLQNVLRKQLPTQPTAIVANSCRSTAAMY